MEAGLVVKLIDPAIKLPRGVDAIGDDGRCLRVQAGEFLNSPSAVSDTRPRDRARGSGGTDADGRIR